MSEVRLVRGGAPHVPTSLRNRQRQWRLRLHSHYHLVQQSRDAWLRLANEA